MDGSRFDALMRLAGEVSTRRIALRSALAAAAASGIVAVGLASSTGETEAKKKKKCKKCKPLDADAECDTNKQCCTNETNRACAVPVTAGASDKTCCGSLDGKCGGFDGLEDIPPICCSGYACSSITESPGVCEPADVV